MEIRLGALRLYRQHLVAQYSDRCAFWSLRDLSSEVMAKTITIITDGADQDLELNYEKFWGVHMSTCTHTHTYGIVHLIINNLLRTSLSMLYFNIYIYILFVFVVSDSGCVVEPAFSCCTSISTSSP